MSNLRILIVLCILISSCKQEKRYHDAKEDVTVFEKSDKLAGILEFQKELNLEFKDPEVSPLADKYRKDFESLDFFLPDTSYVVQAKFVRTPEALPFLMPTTTDRKSEEVVYAIVEFTLNGDYYKLEVYQNPELILQEKYRDYLFLPFTDLTNGKETYGGGRYLDLRIPEGDTIVLDFNRAYNPYCAYSDRYSCPITPRDNYLDTEIKAGVMAYKKQ